MVTNTKGLDSIVWILIQNPELNDSQYRKWIDTDVILRWLFVEGNHDLNGQEFGN